MEKSFTRKILVFPTQSVPGWTHSTLSIHPDPWADAIRPADARDLRLNKIAHLRATIAAGIYRVSSATLAEKLMDHMRNNA